ncbi:hypothetical protein CC80DRAFT_510545 [Byssothecium circinans]|uniref:Uncharacterized protein n=1 Tax=Byssothecium circinans TaxID=147558 RepID=A0A6A5T916_9PLEO|nr:hypothetical protein CC80DRAFT_510545 [Byssothecium circinans]
MKSPIPALLTFTLALSRCVNAVPLQQIDREMCHFQDQGWCNAVWRAEKEYPGPGPGHYKWVDTLYIYSHECDILGEHSKPFPRDFLSGTGLPYGVVVNMLRLNSPRELDFWYAGTLYGGTEFEPEKGVTLGACTNKDERSGCFWMSVPFKCFP